MRTVACPNLSLLYCSCAFVQPLIDCAICYKTFRGEIEQDPKPYLHCIHRPALTEVSLFQFESYLKSLLMSYVISLTSVIMN